MKQKLLILLAALLVAVSTHAYNFEVDGIYYNVLSSTEVEVTYKVKVGDFNWEDNCYSGNIIIPSTVNFNGINYAVSTIGERAFTYCHEMTSVVMPISLTSIGSCAFQGCTGLSSVVIPNSVITIGDNAFNGCEGLTSLAYIIHKPSYYSSYLTHPSCTGGFWDKVILEIVQPMARRA